jgi:hypothetical protein
LHPGADQRDQLADEEQPKIAMPQRAERRQLSIPDTLRGRVAGFFVSLGGFDFRYGIDVDLSRKKLTALGHAAFEDARNQPKT